MVEKYVSLVKKSINKISDKDIKNFVEIALYFTPKEFWTAPSSSSGKYHPKEDQGEGGLVRHTIKVATIAEELGRFYNLTKKETDIVVASSILHDICKNGIPWEEHTNYEHGLIVFNFLENFELGEEDKINIKNCVRYHMGRWVEPTSELKRALYCTKLELILQLSDYFSSRKCASFLPGIELKEKDIEDYK